MQILLGFMLRALDNVSMHISIACWLITITIAVMIIGLTGFGGQFWQRRKIIAEASFGLLLAGLPFLLVSLLSVETKVILVASMLWLAILSWRLIFGRLSGLFLQSSTKLNALISFAIILLLTVLLVVFVPLGVRLFYEILLFFALLFGLVISALFLWQAIWTLEHYKLRKINSNLSLKDLPTVTLAIPARNEDHALVKCLQAAVESDYPKLEIIVLDDCSQDKTPQLIRDFAQRGVRFAPGGKLAEGWLGKNQALRTLVDAASGEYILFADVDTNLSAQSISKLVAYALSNKVEMVSVLASRRDGIDMANLLWQLRYYWQIVLPITRKRVPVASQCWLIKTDALRRFGGIKAAKHKIVPEGTFARRLFASDSYRFLVSNQELGITTAKRWTSQNETAIRLLYPTFKRQPVFVMLACFCLAIFTILPFAVLIVYGVLGKFNLYWAMAAAVSVLLLFSYTLVLFRVMSHTWWLAVWFLPVVLVQEFALLVISMLMYEFGSVNWKGRNVCYPVLMATASKLPDIK
ncbi:MAG: glycosyltransferase [Candidatus Woesebacteria bacterium]|jgi:chlorobactene glucosyltransferase